MNKRIRVRFSIIACVTILCVYAFAGFPPRIANMKDRILLGLDLRGGVQFVMRVVTDDAIRAETDRAVENMRQQLRQRDIVFARILRVGHGVMRISGVPQPQNGQVRNIVDDRFRDWEIAADPDGSLLRMKSAAQLSLRKDSFEQAIRTTRNRLDSLGVGELDIRTYGPADLYEFQVQLPGRNDPDRIKDIMKSTAVLELKLVDRGPFPTAQAALESYGGRIPAGAEILPLGHERGPYDVVDVTAYVTGKDLKTAYSSRDQNGRPAVAFTLTADGGKRFEQLTGENVGRDLAIVLDGRIQSTATILQRISDVGTIQGNFTPQQVQDLALLLKSGALPARMIPEREGIVGPALGSDSIRHGVIASVIALSTVSAFMATYYRWAGSNAITAMLLNLVCLLGAMAWLGATLTLPGIAGIVLTIGVGIDSNVLIFERIREELRAGQPPAVAVAGGFKRVFVTLVDTHLAALISAAFLFWFGSGPVQGFAVTLVMGLVSNLFTSVFVSRTLFELVLSRSRGKSLSI
jgi:preprotein translocase subunit SecD